MDRLRVATLQYFIHPVKEFDAFADQVTALVETAADYNCQLLVFPEYFTVQLLTLGDIKRPMAEQVRDLAQQQERYVSLMSSLAREHEVYIAGGTIPVMRNEQQDAVCNQAYLFGPSGAHGTQRKLHMTRFETEEWLVQAGRGLNVFETAFGRVAIAICYDVEFPEIARAAAWHDANILIVPAARTTGKAICAYAIARKPAPSRIRCT